MRDNAGELIHNPKRETDQTIDNHKRDYKHQHFWQIPSQPVTPVSHPAIGS